MSLKKMYSISFGVLLHTLKAPLKNEIRMEQNKKELNENKQEKILQIPINNVKIKEEFNFFDYDSTATIGFLNEYFLTSFGYKYDKCCKCILSLYNTDKKNYSLLLNDDNKTKLSKSKFDKLFLIKVNAYCDCEYKMYIKYMNLPKFDILAKLRELETLNENNLKSIEALQKSNDDLVCKNLLLKEDNKKLKKEEEFEKYKKHNIEDFYDIVIDINSIKTVNTEGWKIKFNENILNKFKEQKKKEEEKKQEQENLEEPDEEQNSITIEVLGNNNK